MAVFKQTFTAKDEEEYLIHTEPLFGPITRADANRGVPAILVSSTSRQGFDQTTDGGRPAVSKTYGAVAEPIIGAITQVSHKGCKVVKRGRFVLQCEQYIRTFFGMAIRASDNGKAENAARVAQQGELCIVGGGFDDSPDGIGEFFLVERI